MAALNVPANSVWSSMNYIPPRGPCGFRNGIISGTCPCLRFMLHPVKAAASFECDGCNHHASFHSLENPAEDAVLSKWTNEVEKAQIAAATAAAAAASANNTSVITRGATTNRTKRRRITAAAGQNPQDHDILITDLTQS
ncbi:hypothetical protein AAFC00_001719 [Neodothiora populina]|uniref:Uncharacterized protein n=1 Tax=Neodothiora populina TaxID=2781224 RepID=A0ABR3PPX3_9PEZI